MPCTALILNRLRRDQRGVAFIEFAYSLPLFLAMALIGLELTNYVTTRMRISQIALHIADHAARMGEGTVLTAKTVSEQQINDVLTGAGLQGGSLNLYTRGRVILTSLEPMANPNTNSRYKITWQRCRGAQAHASAYGSTGDTNLTGIGPATRQVTSPDNSATMFVEIFYRYQPIIAGIYAPNLEFSEIASMTVRERRDLSQIYNTENAPVATCA
jgi:Flp pilus assembly protein TadG